MPRKVKCPCGAVLALPDNLTSPAVQCPKCKRKLSVASAPAAERKAEPNWFVARDKKKQGPYSFAELRQLAEKGLLGENDMVLCEGQGKWTPASQVPGLIPESTPFDTEEGPPAHAVRELPIPSKPRDEQRESRGFSL